LQGRTIVVLAEQGIGDVIQFARYASILKARGATVVLKAHGGMERFARDFDGVDRVLDAGASAGSCDYYVHLMSLPHVLGTTLDDIPAQVPYLRVDPPKQAAWRQRIPAEDGPLRVGLIWAGNAMHRRDRHRSMPLAALRPLFDVPGVRFHSLQKDSRAGDAAARPAALVDLAPHLHDFRDTAAAIDRLDLVICVDTAVAHLAGALRKPVWLLLAATSDFRWMQGRDDTPWYPTMRLFRQAVPGDWTHVIERVRAALGDLAGSGSAAASTPQAPVQAPADEPPTAPALAIVVEGRHGIFQLLPDLDDEARALEYYGEHLQGQVDLVGSLLPADARVLEVGSGVGGRAIPLARRVAPDGHLWLFEPRAHVRSMLVNNLQANRVANLATLLRRGLGEQSLDDLRLERLDMAWIADPAATPWLFDGGAETLWRLRPPLLLAGDSESTLDTMAARAREFGYRCWRAPARLFDRRNFNRGEDDRLGGAQSLALLAIPEERNVAAPPGVGNEI
jgi:hypothetical protein